MISPGSLRPKRKRRFCKPDASGRIASPRSWATTCCVVTACWARRAGTVGRSSSKTSSGRCTAWPVRSSTQTWIKIIRVRDCVCLVEKRGDRALGTVGLGGDSGILEWVGALNAQAALSQAREHQLASSLELPAGSRPTPQPPVPRPEHCEGAAAGLKAAQGSAPPAVPPNTDVVASTQEALLQKLTWASAELGSSTSLETSIQLCSLIRACAEALHSLQQLQH